MFKRNVKQYETAIHWKHGQIKQLLKPGRYTFIPFTGTRYEKFDMRSTALRINGQEIILADRTSLKINIAGTIKLIDPIARVTSVANDKVEDMINQIVQISLRKAVAGNTLDTLLENKSELNHKFSTILTGELEKIGIATTEVSIKDIILPAELRSAYVESASAKARAAAQIEHARGQSAALRHMANSVSVVEAHPQLLQLLSIQKTDKAAQANLNLHFEQPSKK